MGRIVLAFLAPSLLVLAGCTAEHLVPARCQEAFPTEGPPMWSAPGSAPTDEPTARSVWDDPQMHPDGSLSLPQALELALRNSDIVRVSSGSLVAPSPDTAYDMAISDARVRAALAAFDTSFAASLYSTRIKSPPDSFFGPGLSQPSLRDEGAFKAGFVKPLITGGQAAIGYNPDPGYLYLPQGNGDSFNPTHVGELEISVRQPLLRGAWFAVNQAPIRISQIRSEQSAWDFKKAVMASARSVAEVYWELYAARFALKSIDDVLPQMEQVVHLQQEAYKAQWTIYADVAKAQAQLHLYRQERLQRQSEIVQYEQRLQHLLGLTPAADWDFVPTTNPNTLLVAVDPEDAVAQAMTNHPDLVRERLNVQIRDWELRVARNGRLPRLDFQALYRMNGVGEDLGGALSQLATAEYSDWQVGMTFSVPLGRRQATAEVRAAELQLARSRGLLEELRLGRAHQVSDVLQRINFAYLQFQEAELRLDAANKWVQGARLRYQNPMPAGEGRNWLLESLNDYLDALRFRTEAVADSASLLARYNSELIRLEEVKGTLLAFLGIQLVYDPCRQARRLEVPQSPTPDPQPTEPESIATPPGEPDASQET